MASVIEMLAIKKKPAAPEAATALPMLQKEHEGACGDNCGCGTEGDEGSCCSG